MAPSSCTPAKALALLLAFTTQSVTFATAVPEFVSKLVNEGGGFLTRDYVITFEKPGKPAKTSFSLLLCGEIATRKMEGSTCSATSGGCGFVGKCVAMLQPAWLGQMPAIGATQAARAVNGISAMMDAYGSWKGTIADWDDSTTMYYTITPDSPKATFAGHEVMDGGTTTHYNGISLAGELQWVPQSEAVKMLSNGQFGPSNDDFTLANFTSVYKAAHDATHHHLTTDNVGATIEEMQKEIADLEKEDQKKMAALEKEVTDLKKEVTDLKKEVTDLKHHLSVVVEHLKHRG